ncbi:MAG: hemin uptake protein HemP [Betaproteobacteria bacterium]
MIKTGPEFSPASMPASSAAGELSPARPSPARVNSVSSEELLGARGELKIQHNGEIYSLRRTRQGKLILTK